MANIIKIIFSNLGVLKLILFSYVPEWMQRLGFIHLLEKNNSKLLYAT
jgi:hypothetical protein